MKKLPKFVMKSRKSSDERMNDEAGNHYKKQVRGVTCKYG